MYTTCMHALRTHFLPANGYCVLLRGSAAAAGAVWEAACALRGDYDTGFCALSAVLRVCDGAGAKAAAPMARAAIIAVFIVLWCLRWHDLSKDNSRGQLRCEEARVKACIGAPRVKNRCLQRPYFPTRHPPKDASQS